MLAAILDVAVRDRRILSNPARGVTLPRKQRKGHSYLTHEQVHKLANEAGSRGALVLTLAYTGLRWGEVAALRIRSIDFERRRINVTENTVEVSGVIHVGAPKTHKSRTVPLPRFLHSHLRDQAAQRSQRTCSSRGQMATTCAERAQAPVRSRGSRLPFDTLNSSQ